MPDWKPLYSAPAGCVVLVQSPEGEVARAWRGVRSGKWRRHNAKGRPLVFTPKWWTAPVQITPTLIVRECLAMLDVELVKARLRAEV